MSIELYGSGSPGAADYRGVTEALMGKSVEDFAEDGINIRSMLGQVGLLTGSKSGEINDIFQTVVGTFGRFMQPSAYVTELIRSLPLMDAPDVDLRGRAWQPALQPSSVDDISQYAHIGAKISLFVVLAYFAPNIGSKLIKFGVSASSAAKTGMYRDETTDTLTEILDIVSSNKTIPSRNADRLTKLIAEGFATDSNSVRRKIASELSSQQIKLE